MQNVSLPRAADGHPIHQVARASRYAAAETLLQEPASRDPSSAARKPPAAKIKMGRLRNIEPPRMTIVQIVSPCLPKQRTTGTKRAPPVSRSLGHVTTIPGL